MGDGRLVLCDGNVGELLSYAGGKTATFARTGGSPWGAILGTDGAIYVTQGGNVPGSGDTSAVSGIQRVAADGTVQLLFSEVAGYKLYGPNDLAFGPDGRLYFTESGSEGDFAFDARQRLYWTESMAHRICRLQDGAPVTFCQLSDGHVPDGMAIAADGRLFVCTTISGGVTWSGTGTPASASAVAMPSSSPTSTMS